MTKLIGFRNGNQITLESHLDLLDKEGFDNVGTFISGKYISLKLGATCSRPDINDPDLEIRYKLFVDKKEKYYFEVIGEDKLKPINSDSNEYWDIR